MRKRGAGFFFYLEYVWLPLLILGAGASIWAYVGLEDLANLGLMTLIVVWLTSFLVIGLWAVFLPFAYFMAVPILWCAAAMALGISLGNMAGIGWELWKRRRAAA